MILLRELLKNRRWIYVHSLEYINKSLKVMIIIHTNTQSTKGLVPQVLTRIYLGGGGSFYHRIIKLVNI